MPPTRLVALLRAINVGGHIVRMDALRDLFTQAGYIDVRTVIASGNVIFSTPARSATIAKLEDDIRTMLTAALGYSVDTFVRTPAELQGIADRTPFDKAMRADTASTLYVHFLRNKPDADAAARLKALENDVDRFTIDGKELYWMQQRANGRSRLTNAQLDRAIGAPSTSRNITSVRRIAAAASGD